VILDERRFKMARDFWYCNVCNAQNSVVDGECQFCECQGKDCKRDNCSDPRHFEEIKITFRPTPSWLRGTTENEPS
jgi:hypothetical protein